MYAPWNMLGFALILSFGIARVLSEEEPVCNSRWDYEYKTMKQLLKLETDHEALNKIIQEQREVIKQQWEAIESLQNAARGGSTFIRWGRNVCPGNTRHVYKGYTAGKGYNQNGGGSDNICLPDDPTWLNYTDGLDLFPRALVYGTEIDINEPSNVFPYRVNEQDMPCVVCLTMLSETLMIPGRGVCYNGWTNQYSGYLMSGYHGNHGSYDHICVDSHPEFIPNGQVNHNEHILYLVEAKCGSLPCPPYVEGREVTCAVCSI